MSECALIVGYLSTDENARRELDARRRSAEVFASAETWKCLAQEYAAQGRPAAAESCKRRADYYQQVEAYS